MVNSTIQFKSGMLNKPLFFQLVNETVIYWCYILTFAAGDDSLNV